MRTKLDNPGGGDCLFYALSVGLIDAIQNLPEEKANEIWDLWVVKGGIKDISLEMIQSIDFEDHPFKKHKDIMLQLQSSLRTIAAEAMKDMHKNAVTYQYGENSTKTNDLKEITKQLESYEEQDEKVRNLRILVKLMEEKLNNNPKDLDLIQRLAEERGKLAHESGTLETLPNTLPLRQSRSLLMQNSVVENSPIYKNFSLMVEHYKEHPRLPLNDNLNILNTWKLIHELAKQAANYLNEAKLKPEMQEEYLINMIKDNEKHFYSAVDAIKKRYMWGSHENAGAILTVLKVNSKINTLGVSSENSVSVDPSFGNAPMIELNNHNNSHWTTQVFDLKQYLHYSGATKGAGRYHGIDIIGKDFADLKVQYQKLKSDGLKTQILKDFKVAIKECKTEVDLDDYVTEFKKSPEYKVLASAQGFYTKHRGLTTSSVKAVDEIIKDAKASITNEEKATATPTENSPNSSP